VDHAWIAGGDEDSLRAQRLYQNRVLAAQSIDTNVFTAKQVTLLTDLYSKLEHTSTIAKPIGDLFLISHGTDAGWMSLDLDAAGRSTTLAAAKPSTDFAELQDILADTARKTALSVPATLYTTATNTTGPTRVIIGGCRVGMAPKFVDALKLVLGGTLPVLAPRHYHMFVDLLETDRAKKSTVYMGTYEALCYVFEANSLKYLNKADLLKALADNPKNVTIDGNRVLPASLKQWLGKNFHGGRGIFKMPVRVPLGRKIAHETQLSPGQLRHLEGKVSKKYTNPSPAQLTLAGHKQELSQDTQMQPAFGFPVWEQHGHSSFELFFNSYNWKLSNPKSGPARWVGTREEYLMLVPITSMDPAAKGKLLYNFFPPRTGSTLTAIKELDETDPALYYRTP
jgi:hypothetical protein